MVEQWREWNRPKWKIKVKETGSVKFIKEKGMEEK